MTVDLHLLSNPGIHDIRWIIEACQPYLAAQSQPALAFLQWAAVHNDWLPYTQKVFAGMAEIAALDPDPARLAENERALGRCGAVYISGGNTYLLNHRLHTSGLLEPLCRRAQAGLPIVGFSAGAIVCGPNILTNHDINMLPTTHFNSLNLLPYNIVAHYPAEETLQADEDDWLSDYFASHNNPVLALENDSYVCWRGEEFECVRGHAWLIEKGKERVRVE